MQVNIKQIKSVLLVFLRKKKPSQTTFFVQDKKSQTFI